MAVPVIHFGHEAAGEVVEVAQPGRVQVGDRCGGATTERLW